MKNKILIVVSVLVFVILAVVVFVVQKKNTSEMETQNQGQIQEEQKDDFDVSNWKTYKDERFGYEIKYPENIFLKDCASTLVGFTKSNEDIGKCEEGEIGSTAILVTFSDYPVFNQTPEKYIELIDKTFRENFINQNRKDIVVDGRYAVEFSGILQPNKEKNDFFYKKDDLGKRFTKVVLPLNKKYVVEFFLNYSDEKTFSEYEKIFDTMVSTFEFTK